MNVLSTAIKAAFRRPVIIILPAAVMLVLTCLNSYNPLMPLILGLSSTIGGSFFDGLISALQLLVDPDFLPSILLFTGGAVLLVSLLAGVILSGYFHIIGTTLEGNRKAEGDFIYGIKKYFSRIFLITLKSSLITFFISCFMLVSTVPAVIITRAAATGKPELLIAAILVDILTAGALFFSCMFLRVYLFFWYPSSFKNTKNPFKYAKRIVDGHFWQIVSRFILFDIVFIVFQYLVVISASIILKLLLGWVFTTIFFTVFVVYIFYSYSIYSGTASNIIEGR